MASVAVVVGAEKWARLRAEIIAIQFDRNQITERGRGNLLERLIDVELGPAREIAPIYP